MNGSNSHKLLAVPSMQGLQLLALMRELSTFFFSLCLLDFLPILATHKPAAEALKILVKNPI